MLSQIQNKIHISNNLKYEYEEEMEKMYQASLVKSFKKQIDDGYFSLILVDCINDKTEHYQQMWSYAKQKGFEVSKTSFMSNWSERICKKILYFSEMGP